MATKKSKLSFTETIGQLEALVSRLEDSNTSLEESLAGFEEGVQLLRKAQSEISEAEQKVHILVEDTKAAAPDSSTDEFAE